MQAQPHAECDCARDRVMSLSHFDDGRIMADHRHVAHVPIVEWLWFPSADLTMDVGADMVALLLCDRSQLRQRLVRVSGVVPDRVHVVVAGNSQVGSDDDSVAARSLRIGCQLRVVRCQAAGPDDEISGQRRPVVQGHAVSGYGSHGPVHVQSHTDRFQGCGGELLSFHGHACERGAAVVHEVQVRVGALELRVRPGQQVIHHVRDGSRDLDSCGSCPHHDDSQRRAALHQLLQTALDRVCVRSGIERKCMFLGTGHPEEVDGGPRGQNEMVRLDGPTFGELDHATSEVDRRHTFSDGVDPLHLAVVELQICGVDQACRRLVEQRLERLATVLLDQRDRYVVTRQLVGGVVAPESTADDDGRGGRVSTGGGRGCD